MEKQGLYKDLASYYDLIYHWKDYKKEVERVEGLISMHKQSKGNELLDIGCGTGNHLLHLKDRYRCTGIDVNEEMLAIARDKLPGVTLEKADVVTMRLGRRFDVILSLFGTIGYITDEGHLKRAFRNIAGHMNEGGVLIFEPWIFREDFTDGQPSMTNYDGDDIKIARLSVSRAVGDLSVFEFHYLIAERGKAVKYSSDRHELLLTDEQRLMDIIKEAGLRGEYLEERISEHLGLCIAHKG